eukprot:1186237-Prorocentrum_minimum.AAC.1
MEGAIGGTGLLSGINEVVPQTPKLPSGVLLIRRRIAADRLRIRYSYRLPPEAAIYMPYTAV